MPPLQKHVKRKDDQAQQQQEQRSNNESDVLIAYFPFPEYVHFAHHYGCERVAGLIALCVCDPRRLTKGKKEGPILLDKMNSRSKCVFCIRWVSRVFVQNKAYKWPSNGLMVQAL